DILELISDFLLSHVHLCDLLLRHLKILVDPVLPRADLEVVESFFLILALRAPSRPHWTRLGSGPEKKPEKKQNYASADCPWKPWFRFQLFQNRHGCDSLAMTRRWHRDDIKAGSGLLLDWLAGFLRTRLQIFVARGNGNDAGKVDLLNSQEHREFGEIFYIDNVAVKHRRPVRFHELHGEKCVTINFFFIRFDD